MNAPATLAFATVEAAVRKVITDLAPADVTVTDETTLQELRFDSLDMVEVTPARQWWLHAEARPDGPCPEFWALSDDESRALQEEVKGNG